MKRLLALLWLGAGLLPALAFGQAGQSGEIGALMAQPPAWPAATQNVNVVVPGQITNKFDVSIPSTALTAVEVTGNTGLNPSVNGVTGVAILNWSAAQDIYCCDNDAQCSVSAGLHHGWPILRQPTSGNYNWQYFSVNAWGQLWCIATGSSVTATLRLFR